MSANGRRVQPHIQATAPHYNHCFLIKKMRVLSYEICQLLPPPAQQYSASGGYSLAVKGGAGLLLLLLAILVYILVRGRCSCTTECNGGADDSSQASGGTPRAMHFIAGE
ncbi:hypothetical protein NC652_029139 [Populus alba x Populus x berolinensis]|nr:hypothetical protein NC652_029139 [Populus alba x Populus x berolinensis]